MKYQIISAIFDVTKSPPEPVEFTRDDAMSKFMDSDIIDTEDNILFQHCKHAHDVEDTFLAFWNRLNEPRAPHFTHNPHEKVVVIDCRPCKEQ